MNFSVPGSGKTATILGTYAYLKNLDLINKIVVIGPINCFKAWKEEYQTVISNSNEFDILDLHEVGHKTNKEYFLKYDYPKSKVVLINFEGLGVIADKLAEVVDSKTMIVLTKFTE